MYCDLKRLLLLAVPINEEAKNIIFLASTMIVINSALLYAFKDDFLISWLG